MSSLPTRIDGATLHILVSTSPDHVDLDGAIAWAREIPAHQGPCVVTLGDVPLATHGVVVLDRFCRELEARGASVRVVPNDADQEKALRAFVDFKGPPPPPSGGPARPTNIIDVAHTALVEWAHVANRGLSGTLGVFLPRPRVRSGEFLRSIADIGNLAIPLVALIAALIGAVLSWQSAPMFEQYGQGILVAQLIAMSMLREIGPLLTAILVAGRSGSALAAELGTMKVSEELDAMEVMGSDPIRVIVAPRLLAFMVALPILVTIADIIGIAGGGLAAVTALDLRWDNYLAETQKAIELRHVVVGLVKSILFGFVICTVSAREGFLTSGGPTGVGRSTTRSVVFSIIWIIVVDAVFTRLLLLSGN